MTRSRLHSEPKFELNSPGAIILAIAVVAAFGFVVYKSFADSRQHCYVGMAKPPSDYRHVTSHGVTLNKRAAVMLDFAEEIYNGTGEDWFLYQGSYNSSVSASAGTHSGGGALDASVKNLSSTSIHNRLQALRQAGFAAWLRTEAEGFDPIHIHAIAIGDKSLSPAAEDQVKAYFRGKDGLKDDATDPQLKSIGRPIPDWAVSKTQKRICP